MKSLVFSLGVVTGLLIAQSKKNGSENAEGDSLTQLVDKLYTKISDLKNADVRQCALERWQQLQQDLGLEKVKQKLKKKTA